MIAVIKNTIPSSNQQISQENSLRLPQIGYSYFGEYNINDIIKNIE